MIPKKVVLRNGFGALDEEEDEEAEAEEIGEAREAPEGETERQVDEVVEVTIDSGASRSVWPKNRKGVVRSKGGEGVKLAAANGSPIEVCGEATLHFQRGRRKCAMRFLDADVRRPLGSVSAIVDEGNTVVFSRSGSYISNDASGEKIRMARKGGVFVVELEADKPGSGRAGGARGARRDVVMGAGAEEEEVVFRRRA